MEVSTLKMKKSRLIIIAIAIAIILTGIVIRKQKYRIGIVFLPHTMVRGSIGVLWCRKPHQDNPNELSNGVDHQGMRLANKKQMEIMKVVWFSNCNLQASSYWHHL